MLAAEAVEPAGGKEVSEEISYENDWLADQVRQTEDTEYGLDDEGENDLPLFSGPGRDLPLAVKPEEAEKPEEQPPALEHLISTIPDETLRLLQELFRADFREVRRIHRKDLL